MDIKYYVGVKFENSSKAYYFGTDIDGLKVGDFVIADSIRGVQVGKIATESFDIKNYKSELPLKPIVRKASEDDLFIFEENKKRAKGALKVAYEEIERLKLEMSPLEAEYALDGTKVTITYVADDRVDFRELLKALASRLHCRIELRQIGPRDKARYIGGIGICGLPLCCSTFIPSMEGISINRAKNQMLSLNIPKLSGHCGKLICCLLYEDDNYTELKKDFPNIGTTFFKDGVQFKITSYNVLSRVVKIESGDDVEFVPLAEIKPLIKKRYEK